MLRHAMRGEKRARQRSAGTILALFSTLALALPGAGRAAGQPNTGDPSTLLQSATGSASEIISLSETSGPDALRVTLEADGRVSYQAFEIEDPHRLVVDLPDVLVRVGYQDIDVPEGPVRRVRLAQFKDDGPLVGRLVLTMNGPAPFRIVEAESSLVVLVGAAADAAPEAGEAEVAASELGDESAQAPTATSPAPETEPAVEETQPPAAAAPEAPAPAVESARESPASPQEPEPAADAVTAETTPLSDPAPAAASRELAAAPQEPPRGAAPEPDVAAEPLSAPEEEAARPSEAASPAPPPPPPRSRPSSPAFFTQAAPPPPPAAVVPLEAFVTDALHYNLTLQSARASTESVRAGVQAANSIFDPFVTLAPSYSRNEFSSLLLGEDPTAAPVAQTGIDTGKGVGSGVNGTLPISTTYSARLDWNQQSQENPLLAQGFQPQSNTSLTLGLTQPLLRGFGPFYARAPVTQASLASDAADARYRRLVEQVVADVERSYWSAGLAAEFERLSRDSYERARDLLSRNERMEQLGLITEVDLVTSRRGVQQRLTSLTTATRQLHDAVQALYFLVYGERFYDHLPPDMLVGIAAPPTALPGLLPLEQLEQAALSAREDLDAANRDLESLDVTRRVAGNALLPDLNVSASYTTQTLGVEGFALSGIERIGDTEGSGWRIGFELSYPIFNRAARAANARAGFDYEAQQRALASVEVGVRNEVRLAERALRVQHDLVEQATLAFQYASQQYDGARQQLQLGLIDSFRLLQIEEDVTSAEIVLQQARYELALAISSFELAMGSIVEKYQASLAQATPSMEPGGPEAP